MTALVANPRIAQCAKRQDCRGRKGSSLHLTLTHSKGRVDISLPTQCPSLLRPNYFITNTMNRYFLCKKFATETRIPLIPLRVRCKLLAFPGYWHIVRTPLQVPRPVSSNAVRCNCSVESSFQRTVHELKIVLSYRLYSAPPRLLKRDDPHSCPILRPRAEAL